MEGLWQVVPLFHACNKSETTLLVGPSRERLFADLPRGDSSEGLRQGAGEAATAFCVGLHPEVKALDAELKTANGGAWFDMDDGIAVGPPDVVFSAVQRFSAALQTTTGLVMRFDKLSCFSYAHDLTRCEHRQRFNVPIGNAVIPATDACPEHRANGIIVGGVPIGTTEFVAEHVRVRAEEIVGQITETNSQLHSFPHHAWSVLFYCLAPRFDYILQHVDPIVTAPLAVRIDNALQSFAESCGYSGMLRDPDGSDITLRRFALPARLKGCGVRSRALLAPAAFLANLVTASTMFVSTPNNLGAFYCLQPLFPPPHLSGPEHGGRLATFLASGLPSAVALGRSWDGMQAEVAVTEVTGPLDRAAANAGLGSSTKLQRAIMHQREQVWQQHLQRDIMNLAPTDPRREAYESVDPLSTAWVASWPSASKGWALDQGEFREVFTTYLGGESPCVGALAGQVIQGNGGRRICDSFGRQLCLATLPGDGFRVRHDALVDTVARDVMRAGIQGCTEPRRLFMHVLLQDSESLPKQRLFATGQDDGRSLSCRGSWHLGVQFASTMESCRRA